MCLQTATPTYFLSKAISVVLTRQTIMICNLESCENLQDRFFFSINLGFAMALQF